MSAEDKSARSVLISYLARRDYAEAELRFRLLRKGYTEEETDAKIGRFIQHKLIGDHSQAVVSFDWTVGVVNTATKTLYHGFC